MKSRLLFQSLVWLREAPGWVREQLESSREVPHTLPQLVFPEPFCRPSCKRGNEDSGQWLVERMHFAYFFFFLRTGVK